jgi:hypothetical protein
MFAHQGACRRQASPRIEKPVHICPGLAQGIECYHRAIKQVCGIDLFMVRKAEAIHTHFFSAIRAFTHLELMRAEELIENLYEI